MEPEEGQEPINTDGAETIAEPAIGEGSEEPLEAEQPPSRIDKGQVAIKPRNNIYTLLLLISIIFILVSIYLIGWELRNFYDSDFGILSPRVTEESPAAAPSTTTESPAP